MRVWGRDDGRRGLAGDVGGGGGDRGSSGGGGGGSVTRCFRQLTLVIPSFTDSSCRQCQIHFQSSFRFPGLASRTTPYSCTCPSIACRGSCNPGDYPASTGASGYACHFIPCSPHVQLIEEVRCIRLRRNTVNSMVNRGTIFGVGIQNGVGHVGGEWILMVPRDRRPVSREGTTVLVSF